jgi:flagellar L-ring protein precursor FlgH
MNKQSWFHSSRAWWSAWAILSALEALAGDTLWREDTKPIVADKRATRVGDLLTIVVQQSSVATKDNNTQTTKKTGVDANISSLLFSPAASGLATKGGKLPALKFDAKNDFSGGGSVNNSEKIVDRITVRVLDTLPNGNLVVEGTRQTSFAGEVQDMILRGTVRPEDVLANNTIYSYNVADATIRIVSKGSISDSQKKGWATKVWDKLSPF